MRIKSGSTKLFLFFLISLPITSCNQVYREYDKTSFPTLTWNYDQEIVFTPTINNIEKSYKLLLGLRHIYGFHLKSINVTVRSIAPSGKETSMNYDLVIKDANGQYIGSCGGDLCDLEVVVDGDLKFEEPGQYKYVIAHNIQDAGILGVMEIGLIIDEKD